MKVTMNTTPIEASKAKDLNLRFPPDVSFLWNVYPRQNGKERRIEQNLRKHIETQLKWFAVLSTNELYNIITNNDVPPFFKQYANMFYTYRTSKIWTNNELMSLSPSIIRDGTLREIRIGNGEERFELFCYEDKTKLDNPGVPTEGKKTSITRSLGNSIKIAGEHAERLMGSVRMKENDLYQRIPRIFE